MAKFETLYQQKQSLLAEPQPPRAREAAKKLAISEAEFVALSCGETVYWLNNTSFIDILLKIESIGVIMALTRNEAMVLESHGVYKDAVYRHNHIIINTADIDLRLRVTDWKYGFAVEEAGRQSLQFFDKYGVATHKIYITKKSNLTAYNDLLAEFTTTDGFNDLIIENKPKIIINTIDINSKKFIQDWNDLDDFHKINSLLQKYNITRPQAYRHLGDAAIILKTNSLKTMLEIASAQQIPILMFVPNNASTHIHNGTVNKLMEMGPWFNVLDPKFNLHANLKLIDETWLVVKYTNDQATYSMELFDNEQQPLMMIYLHPDAKDNKQISKLWQKTLYNLQMESTND